MTAEGVPHGYQFHPEFELTPRATAQAIASDEAGFLLVDVREPGELEIVRIEPSVHLSMGELEDRLDELEEHAHDHPAGRIAFLCHHGVRSRQAALYARAMGVANTWSVAGGVDWWAIDVDRGLARY